MSGITPLLDTLLHQVLGPKGNVSEQKLNQPVRNVDPGEGPRALQSDSRTDSRANSQPHSILQKGQFADTRMRGQVTQQIPAEPATNTSTKLHLTKTGRTIAEIIGQYPSLAKAVVAKVPLLAAAETPSSTLVAARLQQSIRHSGLFYEHALKQWYRGHLDRPQLALHPQFLAKSALSSGELAEGKLIPESLQPTVRQQLEMLALPTLRWEGDLWTGLFMSLTLTFLRHREEESKEQGKPSIRHCTWQTDMILDVTNLGPLRLKFTLYNNRLDLQFFAAEGIIDRLESKEDKLRIRLQTLGLDEVQIRTEYEDVEVVRQSDSKAAVDDSHETFTDVGQDERHVSEVADE